MRSLRFFFPLTCLPFLLLLFPHLTLSNQIDETEPQKSINTSSVLADLGSVNLNMTIISHENPVVQVQDKYNIVQSRIVNDRTGRCLVKGSHKNQPPLVLPADSSHLWVSWGWGWFHNCDQDSVIILSEEAGDTTRESQYAVTHSDGKFGHAIFEADPCLTHSLGVKMSNTNEKMKTKVYNEKIDKELYSGMLR